jgi:hypothetical protein
LQTGWGLKWPIVAYDDEFRQALATLKDRTEFCGVLLASFVTIGAGNLPGNVGPNVLVAGVPASVVKVRDGWADAL